jgi:DNA-binding transcriptional ArsR family regulator
VAFPRCEKPNEAEFWAKLAEDDVDFVVVDSLRMANPGANENDNSEAIRPLEHASAFTETCLRVSNGRVNPTVVFIHHTKKSTDGDGWPTPRGAQAIIDQCDFAYAVRQVDKDEASPQLKRVEVKCHKPGDMVLPLPFAAEVRFDDVAKLAEIVEAEFARGESGSANDGGAAGAGGEDLHEAEVRRRILAALQDGPILTKDKVLARTGGRRATVCAELDALKEAGQVVKIKDVGYVLESPERRNARVLEQVTRFDRWKSPAQLAAAASVTTQWVEQMVREGVIVPRISSGPTAPGGYLPRAN